jgi:hypothetical protein
MKQKVFICYRQNESIDFVKHLTVKLKSKFEVLCDLNYNVCDIEKQIDEDIDNCSYFVVILNEKTLDFSSEKKRKDRKWILHEISHVMDNNPEKIIPVLKGKCEMEKIIQFPSDKDRNNTKNNTEDEKYIEQIEKIKDLSGINAIKYTKEDTIEEFFPKLMKSMEGESVFENIKKKYFVLFSIFLIVFGFVAGMMLELFFKEGKNEDGQAIVELKDEKLTLVFAGGGSVSNMIKDITNDSVDIKNYDNSLYLDLPSENAWPLLAEEVMIDHTSDNVANKFYPVCLSAEEAKENDFCKLIDQEKFKSKGTVVSYKLGYDTLIVYAKLSNVKEEKRIFTSELSRLIKCMIIDGDSNENKRIYYAISMDKLSELIKAIKENNKDDTKNKVYIYCTQEGSGTYTCYKEKLKDKGIDITKDSLGETLKWYDQKYALPAFNETEFYIILSSIHYSPDELDTNVVKKGMFVTNNNDSVIICKPMYLYFAGYRSDGTEPLNLPQEMIVLLKELVQRDSSLMKYVDGIGMEMHYEKSDVITPFEDMLKYSSIKRKKKS